MDTDAVFADLKKRRENYMDVYDPVDEKDGSHIKIINNQTFIVHNARGYLPQKVSNLFIFRPYYKDFYLMNSYVLFFLSKLFLRWFTS